MPTHTDLQKSIDDLSAAIDRKNELVAELVAACERLVERFHYIDFEDDAFAYNDLQAARAAIEKAKRGTA